MSIRGGRRSAAVIAVIVSLAGAACGGGESTTPPTSTVADPTTTGPTETTTTLGADPCPDDVFLLEVNDTTQPGGYGEPELTVTCDGDTMTVTSNALIAYEFERRTPNDLAAQDLELDIPLTPVEADVPGAVGLGPIGVAINGIPIFAAFEAPQHGYGDPLSDGLLDSCDGHTAPGGLYHYHAMPTCLVDEDADGIVVGYLNDGYPLVTPFDDGEELSSSYVRIDRSSAAAFEAWEYQAGAGDLDECNGRTGTDGVYRYYLTDTFPYVPFCYHGVTDAAQGDFTGDPPGGG